MNDKKRSLSNETNYEIRHLDDKKTKHDSKNYAPPYSHPGKKVKKLWISSDTANSSPTADNMNYSPSRFPSLSSPRNDSVQSASGADQNNAGAKDEKSLGNPVLIAKIPLLGVKESYYSGSNAAPGLISTDKLSVRPTDPKNRKICIQDGDKFSNYESLRPLNNAENLFESGGRSKQLKLDSDRKASESEKKQMQPQDLEANMKKMIEEVMRYEVKIASLYGRMAKMQKENNSLREDLKMMSDRNVELTVSLWKKASPMACKAFKDGDVKEEISKGSLKEKSSRRRSSRHEKSTREGNASSQASRSKRAELPHMLISLQKGIIKRLEEYEAVQKDLEKTFQRFKQNESWKESQLKEESSFVRDLRSQLIRLHEELKKVREYGNVRAANLKSTLYSQKCNEAALYRKLEESQLFISDSSKYVAEAARHIKAYQGTIAEQKKEISVLLNRVSEEQITKDKVDMYTENEGLPEANNDVTADHDSLMKVIDIQRNDITILNEQLHQEKLKNKTLFHAANGPNRVNGQLNISTKTEDSQWATLNKSYLELRKQQLSDKKHYQERIQEIHKTYRAILNEKDVEHRNFLNSFSANSLPPSKQRENSIESLSERKGGKGYCSGHS